MFRVPDPSLVGIIAEIDYSKGEKKGDAHAEVFRPVWVTKSILF